MRTVDEIDEWIADVVRSIRHSPAWLFVAVMGTAGIVLTVLLFLSLTQELTAGARIARTRPIIEPEIAASPVTDEIDTRLCLNDVPTPLPAYAADFRFTGQRSAARIASLPRANDQANFDEVDFAPVQTPPRRATRATKPAWEGEFDPLVKEEASPQPVGQPDLQPRVEFRRYGATRLAKEERPQTLVERATAPVAERAADWRLSPVPSDGWSEFVARNEPAATVPERYAGDAGPDSSGTDDEEAFRDVQAWPTQTDVGFRVELHGPERAVLSQPGHSHLVIRNNGAETIRRLQIIEPLSPLDTVTDATPAGSIQNDFLHREILRLRTNRERTLSLDWVPSAASDRHHAAQVLAEAFVAATVDVAAAPLSGPLRPASAEEPATVVRQRSQPAEAAPVDDPPPAIEPRRAPKRPSVECAVQSAKSVRVNDVAHVTIHVRNTGEAILHNVRIWADVPDALRHRHGSALECEIGRLAPGETHQATLSVLGGHAGRAVTNIRVVADEPVEAAAAAHLAVIEAAPASVRPRSAPTRRVVPVRDPCCGCNCAPQVTWLGPAF